MTRQVTALALVSFALAACATQATQPSVPDSSKETAKDDSAEAKKSKADKPVDETTVDVSLEAGPAIKRTLGDFFVYRFGGSFIDKPVTMTEQVVALDDELLVVDFVLEEGDEMTALRVRMKPHGNEVVRVSVLGSEGELAGTIADYEQMISKTQFIPDSNDELVGSDRGTCLVGVEELDCMTTTYIVSVGEKEAVLSVQTSRDVPGRDLGGEIIGPNGATVYSARLIDQGNEKPVTDALAQGDLKRFMPEGP